MECFHVVSNIFSRLAYNQPHACKLDVDGVYRNQPDNDPNRRANTVNCPGLWQGVLPQVVQPEVLVVVYEFCGHDLTQCKSG